jgi:hypothetical protein
VSPDFLVGLRIALLVLAALQVALSTVFFKAIQARLVRPLLAKAASQGQPVPSVVRWYFTSRVPALAMTAIPLALAWFVGTAEAAVLLERLRAGT